MLKVCPTTTTTNSPHIPSPTLRRKRALDSDETHHRNLPQLNSSHGHNNSTDCHLERTTTGYRVSILKHIPRETLLQAIDTKLAELKQQTYIPSYTIINDTMGNQLCLEDQIDEEELLERCLSRLDLLQIRSEVAKRLFSEHQFKWIVSGSLVRLFSERDRFVRLFRLQEGVSKNSELDVEYMVYECLRDPNCDIAMCTITICVPPCEVVSESEVRPEELLMCRDQLVFEEVRRLQKERAGFSGCNSRCSPKRCCRRGKTKYAL